jgi:hypothetical protein
MRVIPDIMIWLISLAIPIGVVVVGGPLIGGILAEFDPKGSGYIIALLLAGLTYGAVSKRLRAWYSKKYPDCSN